MGDTIAKPRRERKPARGVIRVRRWTDGTGRRREAWQADFGAVNGKRMMRSFEVKDDAENWLRSQRLALANQGAAAWNLPDAQRIDAVKALEALRGVEGLPEHAPLLHVATVFAECWGMLHAKGRTLREAALFMVKHAPEIGARMTVAEGAAAFEQDAVDHNLRPSSIESIKRRLRKLVARYGARPVAEITRDDADAWLRTLSVKSRNHFRVIAHGMFNFCIDRGAYVADNPFAAQRLRRGVKRDEPLPECLPWRTVEAIMQAAEEHEPSMVPALAIGFFTGLRTAELRGLDWSAVDLDARRITVTPATAKKRRARHVDIPDNLLQWLAPHRQTAGMVAPTGEKWRSRLDAIREHHKAPWPHNAMRHSFASHHLAMHGDAAKTSMQLGHHRDTSMLFEHYRALVTPEDASKYFEIRPATTKPAPALPASETPSLPRHTAGQTANGIIIDSLPAQA